MGVYIRNIDIPEIKRGVAAIINIDDIVFFKTADDIVLIPDHGDLIERDALMARYAEEVKPSNNSDFMRPPRWNDAVQLTELAPVVIPAERSEE